MTINPTEIDVLNLKDLINGNHFNIQTVIALWNSIRKDRFMCLSYTDREAIQMVLTKIIDRLHCIVTTGKVATTRINFRIRINIRTIIKIAITCISTGMDLLARISSSILIQRREASHFRYLLPLARLRSTSKPLHRTKKIHQLMLNRKRNHR